MPVKTFWECRVVTEDGTMFTGLGWDEEQAKKAALKRASDKGGKRFKPEDFKSMETRKCRGPEPRSLGKRPKGK